MKIDLGDGDWADLRHANKIPHSRTMEYRKVFFRVVEAGADIDQSLSEDEKQKAAGKALINSGGLLTMEDLANALVLAVVKDWSFGEVNLETLLEVPTADLKTIQDHCASDEYVKMLQPDFGQDTDPESPTKPSAP
jgi:hypothetical protein